MEALRQYILSVTAAAILCGIVKSLCSGASFEKGIHMLCGLVLAVTVLTPVLRIDLDQLIGKFTASYSQDALAVTTFGAESYQNSLSALIKQKSEAYILDKAAQLNAPVDVSIEISAEDLPLPVFAHIQGDISPYAKHQLSQILEHDLGIPKENQKWTG